MDPNSEIATQMCVKSAKEEKKMTMPWLQNEPGFARQHTSRVFSMPRTIMSAQNHHTVYIIIITSFLVWQFVDNFSRKVQRWNGGSNNNNNNKEYHTVAVNGKEGLLVGLKEKS